MEPHSISTYYKNCRLWYIVSNLRVKDKRSLFCLMRTGDNISVNTFFPTFGFTAGEFATWQVLTENARKPKYQKRVNRKTTKEKSQ